MIKKNKIIFKYRGYIDTQAYVINEKVYIAAAKAIANILKEDELRIDFIIPDSLDRRVPAAVAKAVFIF
jgi:malate dehydrogenase (oxaloacetate-decarboxylating)